MHCICFGLNSQHKLKTMRVGSWVKAVLEVCEDIFNTQGPMFTTSSKWELTVVRKTMVTGLTLVVCVW